MNGTNTVPQGSTSYGQALAATGLIVFLALTVPLVGLLMIPAVVVATLWRTLRDFVADVALNWLASDQHGRQQPLDARHERNGRRQCFTRRSHRFRNRRRLVKTGA